MSGKNIYYSWSEEYPRSTEAWREHLATHKVTGWTVALAMLAGIRGDKASLTALLDLLAKDWHEKGNRHYLELKHTANFVHTISVPVDMVSGLTVNVDFQAADLQVAVALALASDKPSTDLSAADSFNVPRIEALARGSMPGKGMILLPRSSWDIDDERLLTSAIEWWCHMGVTHQPDPPTGKDLTIATHSARLLMLAGGYSGRPESMDCFKKAGHDMSFYTRWTNSALDSAVHFNSAWIKEDASDLPIALSMLFRGAARPAARLLELGEGPEARNILSQTVAALRSSRQTSLFHEAIDDLSKHRKWVTHSQSVIGICEFADELHKCFPSFESQVAQIALFGRLMKRPSWTLGVDVSPLLDALLQLKGHGDQPPMSEVLANWSAHVNREEAKLKSRQHSSPTDLANVLRARKKCNTDAIEHLLAAALDNHNPGFLARLEPALFSKNQTLHSFNHVAILRQCLVLDEVKSHSNLSHLRKTLEFLRSRGLDFSGRDCLVDPKGENILHWLAGSAKEEVQLVDTLGLLLELGCDPEKVDKANRRPADLVVVPDKKQAWLHTERRFKAQLSALEALREIKGSPASGLDSANTTSPSSPSSPRPS